MRTSIAAVLLSLSILPAAFAQADRGSVVGTVMDTTGAVVPGASLTIRNEATNLTYAAASDPQGNYSFLNLPVGRYTLSAQAKGFQKYDVNGIQVEVNQQTRVE